MTTALLRMQRLFGRLLAASIVIGLSLVLVDKAVAVARLAPKEVQASRYPQVRRVGPVRSVVTGRPRPRPRPVQVRQRSALQPFGYVSQPTLFGLSPLVTTVLLATLIWAGVHTLALLSFSASHGRRYL